jgi:hypothetical protein
LSSTSTEPSFAVIATSTTAVPVPPLVVPGAAVVADGCAPGLTVAFAPDDPHAASARTAAAPTASVKEILLIRVFMYIATDRLLRTRLCALNVTTTPALSRFTPEGKGIPVLGESLDFA